MFENRQLEEITLHADRSDDYTAKSLYFIGRSFFLIDEDKKALEFLNRSINIDDQFPEAYFYRGIVKMYLEDSNGALNDVQKALSKNPNSGLFLSGLGDIYSDRGETEMAKVAFLQSIQFEDVPDSSWMMLGQIYVEEGNFEQAIALYNTAKNQIENTNTLLRLWFNVGLIESLHGSNKNAIEAFEKVLELNPSDHHAMSKLIQCFYKQKTFELAIPFREKLYADYKSNKLPDHMKDGFFFDQFEHGDYRVMAFERFQEGHSSSIYFKHIFYITDAEGDVVMTVQSEYSPISKELGGTNFLICFTKGNSRGNSGIGFNEMNDYNWFKDFAMNMVDKQLN
ncbi:MAG: tetratricopeptide repeat protein [Flavobacterium sp.]